MGALFGADRTLEGLSQFLALIPGRLGVVFRAAFYTRVLAKCDWTVFVGFGALLTKVDTRLGSHVYIGPYCQLGWVEIGDDTLLGPSVKIPSGPKTHSFVRLDIPIRCQPGESTRVVIGRDCWLGAGSIIMMHVGEQAVIGAGSTVTTKVPSRAIAVGTPAKTIRSRD